MLGYRSKMTTSLPVAPSTKYLDMCATEYGVKNIESGWLPAGIGHARAFDVSRFTVVRVTRLGTQARRRPYGETYSLIVPVKFWKRKSWIWVLLVLEEFGLAPI